MYFIKEFTQVFFLAGVCSLLSCNTVTDTNETEVEKESETEHVLMVPEISPATQQTDSIVEFSSFKKEALRILAANEATIAVMKTKISRQKNELKAQYESDIEALEVENEKLKVKMKSYSLGASETWDSFKASLSREMDNLGLSILEISEKAKQ